MDEYHGRVVESKLDSLISRTSEFQGAMIQRTDDIVRRVSGLELKLDDHKEELVRQLKEKLARQRSREWEKWVLLITSGISILGLAVAVVGLVVSHPK